MKKIFLYFILILTICQIAFATDYVLKEVSISYTDNPLLGNQTNKVAMMFPLLLLAICLIAAFMDFAAIGVIMGSTITLIIGYVIGLLPVSITWLITLGVMALLFIWKLVA